MDINSALIFAAILLGVLIVYFLFKGSKKSGLKTKDLVGVTTNVQSPAVKTISWQDRLFKGLEKSRTGVWQKLMEVVGQSSANNEEIEELLYSADLPSDIVSEIIQKVALKGSGEEIQSNIFNFFQASLQPVQENKTDIFQKKTNGPRIVMIVGVNGVGKTTTIGKLATQFKNKGFKVLVGACDTFRAAAVDQLQVWCDRAQVDMVRAANNSDPSGVAFDTVAKAYKENYDVCLIDTAGRLHNNVNLMEELAKTKRVMSKINAEAPHEVFLVLDAITGQNAIKQAQEFHKSLNLTGLILTKCDGSAKAGSAIYIIKELQVPAYFVGVGEDVEDLDDFDLNLYLTALLGIPAKSNYLK